MSRSGTPQPAPVRPLVVVLTGGIASGKTAVSDRFAALGVPVIDTDLIAREIVEPGEPALEEIARSFGPEVLDEDGRLDRRRMREIVFANPERRERLEEILHPAIAERARALAEQVDAPYCILVVPLLVETGLFPWADRVLLVDVDAETQIERVMARDGVTREQAEASLAAQASRAERQAIADDVIDNSGTLDELDDRVRSLHREYSRGRV